jgi:hypoxanthine phosphoribosyltransferase
MTDPVPCELVSWSQVQRLARRLALKVRDSGFRPDLLVAIARGGYPVARLISDYLGILDLTEIKVEHYLGTLKAPVARVRYAIPAPVEGRRILLVDDVTDTGDSFVVALEHLRSRGTPREVRTAALHHKRVSPYVPDFYARKVIRWRWIIYPWALIEDLSVLIRALGGPPAPPATISRRLAAAHGIRVPEALIRDVLDCKAW